jgi:hypothetical protein
LTRAGRNPRRTRAGDGCRGAAGRPTGLRPRHRARHLRALPHAGQRSAAAPRDRADAVQPALHAGHEPELEACEKRWVVNRIVDPEQEAAIIALLEERGQHYLRIPFDLGEYGRIGWDLDGFPDEGFFLRGRYAKMSAYDQGRAQAHLRRFKNNYVINNNGARNAALRDGKGRAKWVLPWDGNCFLTERAWSEIVTAVRARPYLKYFTVPMARTTDNAALLDPPYRPGAGFRAADPVPPRQHRGIRRGALLRPPAQGGAFLPPRHPGAVGPVHDDVWDLPRPELSDDAGATGQAGWVARLFSGQGSWKPRANPPCARAGEARIAAITDMLDRLDVEAMKLTTAREAHLLRRRCRRGSGRRRRGYVRAPPV